MIYFYSDDIGHVFETRLNHSYSPNGTTNKPHCNVFIHYLKYMKKREGQGYYSLLEKHPTSGLTAQFWRNT